jgi:23S rRNA (guanosine2251-2'-O)-methyltransferase
VGAEANGDVAWHQADLTGRIAIVLGGEDHGLGPKLRRRCDQIASISLKQGSVVTSLNVSVAAGLLLFERVRQLERQSLDLAGGATRGPA